MIVLLQPSMVGLISIIINDILETPGFGDSPSAALNGRINIH